MQADFKDILNQHQALLSRVAASYEANEALQQELLQEIALAVWQGLTRFNGEASLKTYILKIAHNRAVTHVCKEVKKQEESGHDNMAWEFAQGNESAEPHVVAEQQGNIEQLLIAVRALPVAMRQVLTLTLEGLSYLEIAEVCGITKNHVGVLLQRAKTQLQQELKHV